MRQTRRRDDRGFTLVELVVTITILGLITIPLGDFVLSYLHNVTQTQNRVSDSHDVQIAAAYLSDDVGNAGMHSSYTSTTTDQSVWTSGFPAGACGASAGSMVLLLKWNTWTVAASGGGSFGPAASVAYVNESGVLHRFYCASGSTATSDTTVVHGLQSASVTCSTTCNDAPPPASVTLSLTIATDSSDTSGTTVNLTGNRRQS